MPQPFHNAVITNAGANLLMKAQAGETKIQFTRMAIGSGFYESEEKTLVSMQAQTELKYLENSYPLSSVEIHSEHSVKVTALITNQDPVTTQTLVEHGYYINEIGLYAKPFDDETGESEVLYSIAVTAGENGDFMPPYNGYNPAQIIQDYYVSINNSAEVTIEASGAAALAEDFLKVKKEMTNFMEEMRLEAELTSAALQERIDQHNADETAHLPIRSSIAWLDARLALFELIYNTNVNKNPFSVTFHNLDGVAINGIWDAALGRIAF